MALKLCNSVISIALLVLLVVPSLHQLRCLKLFKLQHLHQIARNSFKDRCVVEILVSEVLVVRPMYDIVLNRSWTE